MLEYIKSLWPFVLKSTLEAEQKAHKAAHYEAGMEKATLYRRIERRDEQIAHLKAAVRDMEEYVRPLPFDIPVNAKLEQAVDLYLDHKTLRVRLDPVYTEYRIDMLASSRMPKGYALEVLLNKSVEYLTHRAKEAIKKAFLEVR